MPNQQETRAGQNARTQFIDSLIFRDYESITQEAFDAVTRQSMKYLQQRQSIFSEFDQENITQIAFSRLVKAGQNNPESLTVAAPLTLLINALQWAKIEYLRNEGAHNRSGKKINPNYDTISLDRFTSGDDRTEWSAQLLIDKQELRPTEATVENQELTQYASNFLREKNHPDSPLNDREHELLRRFFNDNISLSDTGKTFNITQSRSSQIFSGAIIKLRKHFIGKKITWTR